MNYIEYTFEIRMIGAEKSFGSMVIQAISYDHALTLLNDTLSVKVEALPIL